MIRYFKIITVFVLLSNNFNTNAQQKEKQIELSHLSIEKEKFLSILDSILTHEKDCDYYDCKLLFSINIRKSKEALFLSITSETDINVPIGLDPYGFFYHQNHLFVVQGEQCDDIFSACGTKRPFKYSDYNHPDFQPKTGEKVTIYNFNDDSFSQWHYWYANAKFVLEEKSTSCN